MGVGGITYDYTTESYKINILRELHSNMNHPQNIPLTYCHQDHRIHHYEIHEIYHTEESSVFLPGKITKKTIINREKADAQE